jgi:hypothetical protein
MSIFLVCMCNKGGALMCLAAYKYLLWFVPSIAAGQAAYHLLYLRYTVQNLFHILCRLILS